MSWNWGPTRRNACHYGEVQLRWGGRVGSLSGYDREMLLISYK